MFTVNIYFKLKFLNLATVLIKLTNGSSTIIAITATKRIKAGLAVCTFIYLLKHKFKKF